VTRCLVSAGGPAAPGTSPRVHARPTPFFDKNVAVPTEPEVTRRRSSSFVIAAATISAVPVFSSLAEAATVLNVNLSMTIRPGGTTHAASGSLYGVLETHPADVTKLIAPLHPFMLSLQATIAQNGPCSNRDRPPFVFVTRRLPKLRAARCHRNEPFVAEHSSGGFHGHPSTFDSNTRHYRSCMLIK